MKRIALSAIALLASIGAAFPQGLAPANSYQGNPTNARAAPTFPGLPSCADTGGNHLNYINGTGVTCGTGSRLTVGSTTIGSGTTLRVLYDNAGVIGEYTNTQLTALINPATASLSGALPAWPNDTTKFFRGDGTYTTLTPQRSVTAAGGSLQTTDCGASVVFSGATFYSFSVGAATGFDTTCRVTFRNSDPQTGTTGAKILSMTGAQMRCSGGAASSVYLWPQQTASIVRVGSTWMMECPGQWQAPQGTIVINFDPVNGSDTFGASDGLSTGARAFATANNAMYVVSEMMRANFLSQTIFKITCSVAAASCSGTTDNSSGVHYASHGFPAGSQGRAALTLDCNGLTFGSSSTFSLFGPAAIVEPQNCTFATTVALTEGAEMILDTGNAFTPVTGGQNIFCTGGSKLLTNGQTININAGTGQFFIGISNCSASLPAGNLTGNVTYTGATVNVQAAGYLSPFTAWTLNGFTVTGTKYSLIECGILEGSANVPGSVAGAASCTQAN